MSPVVRSAAPGGAATVAVTDVRMCLFRRGRFEEILAASIPGG